MRAAVKRGYENPVHIRSGDVEQLVRNTAQSFLDKSPHAKFSLKELKLLLLRSWCAFRLCSKIYRSDHVTLSSSLSSSEAQRLT